MVQGALAISLRKAIGTQGTVSVVHREAVQLLPKQMTVDNDNNKVKIWRDFKHYNFWKLYFLQKSEQILSRSLLPNHRALQVKARSH